MNNINFEALRGLWLAHGGEPDKKLHPEDYGRYMAARMAESKRPGSRLSEFDEWARVERREQDTADDLHGVRVALERIATTLEAGHGEAEQAPKVMRGVGLDPDPAKEGAYTKVPGIEFYAGIAGFGGVYRDERGASWFAMDMDQEFRAYSPDELRDVAELFRTHYAEALEWVAMQWQEQLDADTVSLLPPESMSNDIADEDNEDKEPED